jgi:hypothetical protein
VLLRALPGWLLELLAAAALNDAPKHPGDFRPADARFIALQQGLQHSLQLALLLCCCAPPWPKLLLSACSAWPRAMQQAAAEAFADKRVQQPHLSGQQPGASHQLMQRLQLVSHQHQLCLLCCISQILRARATFLGCCCCCCCCGQRCRLLAGAPAA